MKTIRAFVAIHLPEAVKQSLAELSQRLAAQLPARAVRWVKPDRMHLTLRFLGETNVDDLSSIATGLDNVGMQHRALHLAVGALGCFPSQQRPRVLWVGIQGDVERLQMLKSDIDRALAPLGWPVEERSFRAHMTLGRVKDRSRLRDLNWRAEVESLPILVSAVHLIESKLRPSGPVYTVRHSSPLT